ncbi:DUF2141 domain-containing protein [Sandaracinobacter sp. RS1-74]|uniref:DUF2141 domain-containing protein n=1 Tax=Sandaracinobacteroides sayramensis TaxID=2913411 RepID=UPI001EDA1056|nr:DUF2141 domain-containing protein [Sandaracinobacteroides sayramensis]MCG2842366.1 DUF2141 domain-containing protein [Sandaracinobacteroides sayramensis]
MLATSALLAAAVFGIPQACTPGANGPAALVTVDGFKDRVGNLRIAIYPANEEDFLASGRYVQRLDTPVTPDGPMTVCAPVPSSGTLIVAALHDRDANGKFAPFKDGVGFSRNPRLGLSKPKIEHVSVELNGVKEMSIVLNYMQGLRPAPLKERQSR